ncbi:MAG: hypothetical protein AB4038_04190, partial [Prochloraceae cyanobacterium]
LKLRMVIFSLPHEQKRSRLFTYSFLVVNFGFLWLFGIAGGATLLVLDFIRTARYIILNLRSNGQKLCVY